MPLRMWYILPAKMLFRGVKMASFSNFKGENEKYTFEDLYNILLCLRAPDGCPWDRVQTHYSLIKPMIEEAYEAVDAIKRDDTANMVEELGDVLLQVIFHSIIGAEEGRFTFEDVVDRCARKMVSRHSHVFGDVVANDASSALENWEKMKKKEHSNQDLSGALSDIPKSFPSLLKAGKVAKKLRQYGAETPEITVDPQDEEKAKLCKAGKELFNITKRLEAEGVNAEEALSFYADEIIRKEAEKNEA